MGYTVLRHREEGGSLTQFKEALMEAKESIMMLCEMYEDMESQLSERGAYGNYSNRDGYSERYGERYGERGRDSMGRFR